MDELKSYPEKLQVLNEILKTGLSELCQFAKAHNYLDFPYGRKADPTPLITEEQFVGMGGLKCDDHEPVFEYEYGFDPLKFLSDYIKWAHPDSVRDRLQKKLQAQARLELRANHAINQLTTHDYLKEIVAQSQSGIEWGPFVIPINVTTTRVVVKPYKPGIIYTQIATDPKFTEIVKTYKVFHFPSVTNAQPESSIITLKDQLLINMSNSKSFDIPNLAEKKQYYLRSFSVPISSPNEEIPNFDAKLVNSLIDVNLSEETKFAFDINLLKEYPINGQYSYNSFSTFPDHNYTLLGSPHKPNLSNYAIHNQFPYETNSLLKLQFFGQLPVNFLQDRWDRTAAFHFENQDSSNVPLASEEEEGMETPTEETNNPEGGPLAIEIKNLSSTPKTIPSYTCFLGDFFQHAFYEKESNYNLSRNETTHVYLDMNEMILFYYYQQLYNIMNNISLYSHKNIENIHSHSSLNDIIKSFHQSFFIAWRDSNPQSSQLLKWEETIYKQYRHDVKKYNKKYNIDDGKKKSKSSRDKEKKEKEAPPAHIPPPPVLKRPPLSPQLDALLQGFPLIQTSEPIPEPAPAAATNPPPKKNAMKQKPDPSILPLKVPADVDTPHSCRMLYRSVMISADVQLIVLDVRRMQGKSSLGCDYLGKEQGEWLQFTLQSSQATWKIICTGKSFGVCAHETIAKEQELAENGIPLNDGPTLDEVMVVKSGSYEDNASNNSNNAPVPAVPAASSVDPEELEENENTNNSENNAPRKESLKQVSLMIPANTNNSNNNNNVNAKYHEHHTNLYDDCDDIFGRSKYSLQYILAEYENKWKEQNASDNGSFKEGNGEEKKEGGAVDSTINAPKPVPVAIQDLNAKGSFHHIQLQSGLVILSGGIGSRWTYEEEIVMQRAPSNTSVTSSNKDAAATNKDSTNTNGSNNAAATANNNNNGASSTVVSPTASRPTTPMVATKVVSVTNVDDVLLPFYCSTYYTLSSSITQPFSLLNGPSSSYRGNPAFCLEVSLGSVNNQSHKGYEQLTNNEGDYYYQNGFDAYTYYSQYHAMLSQPELAQPFDNSFTFAEFYLLADGVLKISVYLGSVPPSKNNGNDNNLKSKVLLYECLCTIQHQADDESDGSVFLV